jgi:hypothetical protein
MKNDETFDIVYGELNALCDGELDRVAEGRVLEAIRRDSALAQRLGELRLTKQLVRHAYRHETAAPRAGRSSIVTPPAVLAAAAVALVAFGIGAGWIGHALQQGTEGEDYSRLARKAGVLAQNASPDRVLLHISSSAPERVAAMLDEAEGMLRAARKSGRTVAIEVVANNTGLDVLRLDAPGGARRLAALHGEFPNLTLVACAQTIERLREKGLPARLLPDAIVATSALDQVVKRIQEGWTYVRA